jgi:serine/threonine-protein kinase RsbW
VEAGARVHFTLPARAENIPLVRHALAGLAEVLGMAPQGVADLKTVVTEACTNAVVHAYGPGESGPLEVSAAPERRRLAVAVRDFGQGIQPLADPERRSLRLGLPLMAALTAGFELSQSPGGGTTVTMRIPFANGDEPAPEPVPTVEETRIDIRAGEALGPVLSRVISMFATRANLSIDRLSDAVLISDAISDRGDRAFPDGTVRLAVTEESGGFEARIGPLAPGGGSDLLEDLRLPQVGANLAGLAEEVRVDEGRDGETVVIRIGRPDGTSI